MEENDKANLTLVYSTEEEYKDGELKPTKYYDFILTHMEVNATLPRKPLSVIRQMDKSTRNKKPMKVMTKDVKDLGNGIIESTFPLMSSDELSKLENRAKDEGKILRIWIPKNGLLVYPGKDTIEFINANPNLVAGIIDKEKH